MVRLTILRGISGSGKSTWAESQAGHPAIVSRDRIRTALFGTEAFIDEDLVTKVAHSAVDSALRAGRDVIVDDTNIRIKYIKAYARIGYVNGADVWVKFFNVELDDAKRRNIARKMAGGRFVPEEIINKQYAGLKGTRHFVPEAPTLAPYGGTPGKPKAFLFDLDGTVYHMNGKRGPYDHNVDVDDPDMIVQDVVKRLQASGLKAIAMSGRVTATMSKTIESLLRDGIIPDELVMRADGDMRSDDIIKAELFDKHIRDNYDVQFVIDDRRQVVDMWQAMGLKVFNVAGKDRGEF